MTYRPSAIERFQSSLEEARPPTGSVALETVRAEVVPVLGLLAALPANERMAGDFDAVRFRECFTVLMLLGRRLALLDLTPTAGMMIVDLALRALDDGAPATTSDFHQRARAASIEGFVLGREERVTEDAEARAARSVRPLRINARTFGLVVSGAHSPESISEYVDALGRAMLDADASVAIVDLTQLGEPNRERAKAVFAAEEVARMLGASCIFSGVDPRWRAAASDAHVRLDALHVVPTLAKALDAARVLERHTSAERNPKWRALLERLRR